MPPSEFLPDPARTGARPSDSVTLATAEPLALSVRLRFPEHAPTVKSQTARQPILLGDAVPGLMRVI